MDNTTIGITFKYNNTDYTSTKNQKVDGMQTLEEYKKFLCGEYTKKKTRESYYTGARLLLETTNGYINSETLQTFTHTINQQYPKQNSRRIRLHGANIFLKWLKQPYKLKLPAQENTNQHVLNEKQINTILDIAKYQPETNLITQLLWDGCLRDNTIINIKTNDRQENKLYLQQTKTGDKHIVLSPPLMEAWDNYLEYRLDPKPEYYDYLLINPIPGRYQGEKYHSIHRVIKTIKTLGQFTQIPYTITPYTIRRTSATLRQDKFSKYYAGDSKLVQMMFNHSDIRTTMKYNQKTDNDIEKYLKSVYIHQDKSYISPQSLDKTIVVDEEQNNSVTVSTTSLSFEPHLSFFEHELNHRRWQPDGIL